MAERKGFEPSVAINYTAFPMLLLRPLGHLSKKMVGVEGFEPTTLWSQTRCATRLRYTPNMVGSERFELTT